MFFVFDTKIYGSNTCYIQDCNEIIQKVPNPVTSQIKGILARFFMTKKYNKRVIVKTMTYWPLTEEEKQNVDMVVSNKSLFFNNKKSLFVGFHKHTKRSSNI